MYYIQQIGHILLCSQWYARGSTIEQSDCGWRVESLAESHTQQTPPAVVCQTLRGLDPSTRRTNQITLQITHITQIIFVDPTSIPTL